MLTDPSVLPALSSPLAPELLSERLVERLHMLELPRLAVSEHLSKCTLMKKPWHGMT